LVVNPYQASDGVYAKLTRSKLKCPLNLEEVPIRLHHFYSLLKPVEFGPTIDMVIFWFGSQNQYCAIVVGPFGRVSNYQEEMLQFQQVAASNWHER